MNYAIKNLGPINDININLRPLTVVCGANNTGKSYLTYSFYTLFEFLKTKTCNVFDGEKSRSFLQEGQCSVNLGDVISCYNAFTQSADIQTEFKSLLPRQLLLDKSTCEMSWFGLSLDAQDVSRLEKEIKDRSFNFPITLTSEYTVRFIKPKGQSVLRLVLEPTAQVNIDVITRGGVTPFLPAQGNILKQVIPLVNIIIRSFAINHFIITCERTGVTTFRPELSLLRDFVYNAGHDRAKNFIDLKSQSEFKGYSLPIETELEFALHFSTVAKMESSDKVVQDMIVPFFEEIANGNYESEDTGSAIYYRPRSSDARLSMSASSSSARTLLELYFYLKFKAKVGQTLLIDEPELNLHPSAQRKMARLFARLVNCGVNVFITTHSDYIVRELNALMSMNSLPATTRDVFLQKHGYKAEELLSQDKIGCYVLKKGGVTESKSSAGYGFAVESFDDTITQFNSLYNDLHDILDEVMDDMS